ncbi:holo-ACP synthase [Merdibacter massiliensis]|uniref:holo-ACP synthase n=1 Tax=Merdibacter massiliensis TaxID=1871030 RepID=UPI00096A58B9|nr:holo-ACP synthase [Merdibacter massiliensis]
MKIGCDIVEIARVQRALERSKGFPNFLTENEQAIFLQLKGKRRAEWLAGRFAAKEAIIKAMHGVKELTLLDVEVLQDSQGAPVCSLQGIEVSIAHERAYAIAYAIKQ